jgi:hypothetical protein
VGNWLIDGLGLGGEVVGERVGDFVVSSSVGFDDTVGLEEGDPLGGKVGDLDFVGSSVGMAVVGCCVGLADVGETVGAAVGLTLKDGISVARGVGANVGRLVFGALVGQREIVGAHVGRFVVGAFVGQRDIVGDQVGRLVRNSTGALDIGDDVG